MMATTVPSPTRVPANRPRTLAPAGELASGAGHVPERGGLTVDEDAAVGAAVMATPGPDSTPSATGQVYVEPAWIRVVLVSDREYDQQDQEDR